MTRMVLLFIWTILCAYSILTEAQNVTTISTSNSTTTTYAPPQVTEYTVKAKMVLTFGSGVFISAYNNNASAEYLSFTNDIKTKMTSSLHNYRIRLIEIIFNSIRNGSVIVDTQVTTASTSPLSDTTAPLVFQWAVTDAYGRNVTSTVNITQSSSMFFPTYAPPQVTEYTVKAKMVLTFGSGVFISAYNNNASAEYLSFTNDTKTKMTNELRFFGFQLIEMIFNSIRNGSVIVDTQVTTASTSPISDTTAVYVFQLAVARAYGPNVTSTVNITQSSSMFFPTYAPPQFGEYTVKAQMVLTFGSGVFISAYNNNASAEYLSFTNDTKTKMTNELKFFGFRLIEMIFNSIRNGSVIVDTQVTIAVNVFLSDVQAVSILQYTVQRAYGSNVTSAVNITQSSSMVTSISSILTEAQNTTTSITSSILPTNNATNNGTISTSQGSSIASSTTANNASATAGSANIVSTTTTSTNTNATLDTNAPPTTTTTVHPTTTTTVPPTTTTTVPLTTTTTVHPTTTTTVPPTTATTIAPSTTTTIAPAQPGEYTVKAKMELTFGGATYNTAYNNTSSTEYLSFTNDIFNKIKKALQDQAIRLLEILFNSIRSGSVIVDMQVTTASATAQTNAAAVSVLQSAVTTAYGANVTSKVNITQSSMVVPNSTTTKTGSTITFSQIVITFFGFSLLMLIIIA